MWTVIKHLMNIRVVQTSALHLVFRLEKYRYENLFDTQSAGTRRRFKVDTKRRRMSIDISLLKLSR